MNCELLSSGVCTHPIASEMYRGGAQVCRPSRGTCARCAHYEGPERTPEMIAEVTGITVGGIRASPPRPTWTKIKSALRAEFSLLREGPVPETVYRQRIARCRGTRIDPDDGRAYCTRCGCGARRRAKYDVRMHMPSIECRTCGIEPARGEGRKALGRIGGLTKQVRGQIRAAIAEVWRARR